MNLSLVISFYHVQFRWIDRYKFMKKMLRIYIDNQTEMLWRVGLCSYVLFHIFNLHKNHLGSSSRTAEKYLFEFLEVWNCVLQQTNLYFWIFFDS